MSGLFIIESQTRIQNSKMQQKGRAGASAGRRAGKPTGRQAGGPAGRQAGGGRAGAVEKSAVSQTRKTSLRNLFGFPE
jgi:hypothetical protein